jgi:hypothetical protein
LDRKESAVGLAEEPLQKLYGLSLIFTDDKIEKTGSNEQDLRLK